MAVSFGNNVVAPVQPQVKQKSSKIRYTKNGNPYKHTNTGKKVGVGLGLGFGVYIAAMVGLFTRSPQLAVIAGVFKAVKPVVYGLIGGAIVDGIVNHQRKKNADKPVTYMV